MTSYLQIRTVTRLKFCIRNAFMCIMTQAKFHFNRVMLTFIFGIRASEARAWQTTEKAGPGRANYQFFVPVFAQN